MSTCVLTLVLSSPLYVCAAETPTFVASTYVFITHIGKGWRQRRSLLNHSLAADKLRVLVGLKVSDTHKRELRLETTLEFPLVLTLRIRPASSYATIPSC